MNENNNETLLTISEVAVILKISETTIYEYIRTGKLKAQRLGGAGKKNKLNRKPWRVWENDLVEFINSGTSVNSLSKVGTKTIATEPLNNS